MGNPDKRHNSSTNKNNSDSESDSVKEKKRKSKKHRSSSESDVEDDRQQKRYRHSKEEANDKSRKYKYDDVQKSKWDSPAENSKTDKKSESRKRPFDDSKDTRKYHDRSNDDRRGDYRRHDFHRNRGGSHFNRGRNDYRNKYNKGRSRSRERSHSKDDKYDRNPRNRNNRRSKTENEEEHKNYEWGKSNASEDPKPKVEKEKPNFGLSGKLTEETNTYRGIVIKYSEPPEARKPKRRWRLYPFKGEKALPTLYIHRESAYLMGRERKVVDFPLDHPSCSKQHAVLQYRLVPFTREDGSTGKRVRPYLIDLDSANGTFINNKRLEPRKYVELLEKDVIKFGYSTREYVLLHENSKDEAMDDDVKQEEENITVKEEQE